MMVAEAALVLDRLESRKAARLKVPIDNGRNLELRRVLETLDSRTRDTLRRVLIHGRADPRRSLLYSAAREGAGPVIRGEEPVLHLMG
jgi:hypothetical protein